MKKILGSLLTVTVLALVVFGVSQALFSDVETSVGNTLQAGALDLRIDSTAHYVGMVCESGVWVDEDDNPNNNPRTELLGQECKGSWPEADLTNQQFFNLTDIKPGDWGENTISVHVYTNDAWGRFSVSELLDQDNTCEEPEDEAEDPETADSCGEEGELAENVMYSAWLDQGSIAGFQCVNAQGEPIVDCNDPQEGDNIPNGIETEFWNDELANVGTWNMWELLAAEYNANCADVQGAEADGHNEYGVCHGLAADGRLVGSTTYFFGLAWTTEDMGNEAQTDSLVADLTFEVEQHRNNSDPFAE